ncbi:MAG: hypothetical protein OXH64_03945 [Rhodospirillaceae bacterium]|nr:hypothetical protein [Rhodospirillaceae bacterium]
MHDLAEEGRVGTVVLVRNRLGELVKNDFSQPGGIEGSAEEGRTDGSDLRAQAFESGNRARNSFGDFGIEPCERKTVDKAETQSFDPPVQVPREILLRQIERVRVAGIVAGHRRQQCGGVGNPACNRPCRSEAPAPWKYPAATDPPIGRPDSDDAASRRRPAHGAAGIGAYPAEAKPRRHRSAGAARRAAGVMAKRPGVSGIPEMGIEAAFAAGGEFVHVGLAEDDGAGRLQPRYRRRIPFGDARCTRGPVQRGPDGCRISGDIRIVLDDDWNAVQRAPVDAVFQFGVQRDRCGDGKIVVDRDQRVEPGLQPVDSIQKMPGQRIDAEGARPQSGASLGNARRPAFGAHGRDGSDPRR